MDSFENFLWNFRERMFSTPTNPTTIFADTKTLRHYDSLKEAPQLIGEQGLLSISRIAEAAEFNKGDRRNVAR